ncbi:MAG: hypothetical protein Q9168_003182 [Polycauliona sp. 1 TL-2023]
MTSQTWKEKLPNRSLASEKTQLLVLLVTPSYIGILAQGDRFIPDLLRQTYRGWVKGQVLDVLVAVVDRISLPTRRAKDAHTVTLASAGEVDYSGTGISALLTDSATAASDLWSRSEGQNGEKTETTPGRSTLSFRSGPIEESTDRTEANAAPISSQSQTIKLPVANTIFHNGRESSIQAQRWIVGETMLEPTLACIKRSWLHQQVLRIPFPSPNTPGGFPIQLFAPLVCISRRQRVATSMGNVIRQLHSVDLASESSSLEFQSEAEPASKQLEHAVDQWIKKPGNERQAVEVWALVRPPTVQDRFYAGNFTNIIKAGGHFHKVLSGGGGWGNRQGLLALDPEVDFDLAPELTMAQDFDNGNLEVEEGKVSSQIVNPGDIVEFLVRKRVFESSSTRSRKATRSMIVRCPPCVIFGSTPSTVDAMPESSSTPQRPQSSPDCIFVPQHFGALSEQGVSLTATSIDGEIGRSKIDFPHAMLSCGIRGYPVHADPLLQGQSAGEKRSQKHQESLEELPKAGVFRRYRFVPDADTNPPEPRSEYSASGPAGQNEETTLAAALARLRKEGWTAVPDSQTSKDTPENKTAKKFRGT